MQDRTEDRHVTKLDAVARVPQEQSAPGHVAAANEVDRRTLAEIAVRTPTYLGDTMLPGRHDVAVPDHFRQQGPRARFDGRR